LAGSTKGIDIYGESNLSAYYPAGTQRSALALGRPAAGDCADPGGPDGHIAHQAAVHSLARGAVWVTYRPDMAISEIATLQRMARDRTYILVSPYPEQQTPLVATAWGVQLPLYDPQDNRLTIFLARYRQGAQVPEAGQPCTGGVGEPTRPSGVYQRNER
jgi:hypothetical protein